MGNAIEKGTWHLWLDFPLNKQQATNFKGIDIGPMGFPQGTDSGDVVDTYVDVNATENDHLQHRHVQSADTLHWFDLILEKVDALE